VSGPASPPELVVEVALDGAQHSAPPCFAHPQALARRSEPEGVLMAVHLNHTMVAARNK
jgi:hypothetical protein